jgi:hypothetical protein
MTQRTVQQIIHVSPKIVPLMEVIAKGVADNALIEAQAFATYFPPDVLAACMQLPEYNALRGIILLAATGMELEFGQTADLEITTRILSNVYRRDPTRYFGLRAQISHLQFVEMAPVGALTNYLFAASWWMLHWNQNKGDAAAPSAKVLIAALNAIDEHKILTPSQKFTPILRVLIKQLDEATKDIVLEEVIQVEQAEGKLAPGAANASMRKFAPNDMLVARLPPDELIKIVFAGIEAYAQSTPQGRSTLSPPPVLFSLEDHAGGGSGDSPAPFMAPDSSATDGAVATEGEEEHALVARQTAALGTTSTDGSLPPGDRDD